MTTQRIIAILLILSLGPSPLFAQSSATSDPIESTAESTSESASPTLEDRPRLAEFEPDESQLSPAIAALLDSAEADLADDPAAASDSVIALLLSTDPVSRVQRELYAERAADILRRAAAASDDSKRALITGDAAWMASGRARDPAQAGRLLVSAQNTDSEAESLWLVRRALLVDPSNAEAAALDHELSTNPNATVGWSMFFGGLGLIVVGIVAGAIGASIDSELKGSAHTRADADDLLSQRNALAAVSYTSYGVGLLSFVASGFVLSMGSRDYRPVSPTYLPALEDRR